MDIPCRICSGNSFIPIAKLRVSAQIACGAGISGVEVTSNKLDLATATRCSTLKDVRLATFKVLDCGGEPKEDINRSIPFLRNAIYVVSVS